MFRYRRGLKTARCRKKRQPCQVDVKSVGGSYGASQRCLLRPALWRCRGAASNTESCGPTTETTAATAEKVDAIANTVPEDIKSSRQADRRRQHSVHAQRVQGPQRQDRRLRRRPDERDRLHPRPDGGVSRGGLRQDHPVDPGRHLQRRHVVVHRHQGARADGRLRHLLLCGLAVGCSKPGAGSIPRTRAARRSPCRPPRPRRPRSCPRKEQEMHRRRPAGDRHHKVRRPGRGHQRRGARPGRRDVGGLAGHRSTRSSRATASSSRRARSSTPRRTAGR